jgi:hypothetical protein
MLSLLLFSGMLFLPGPSGTVKTKPLGFRPALLTTIPSSSVSPSVVTFSATDPTNSPVVNASASVVVSWTAYVSVLGTWNVKVSAPATFSSCGTVPSSAVTVSCTSVTGGSGGTCSSSSALSTSGVQVASGSEIINVNPTPYSVTLSFTLQDSWKYIASSSCTLAVTYTITAN